MNQTHIDKYMSHLYVQMPIKLVLNITIRDKTV